MPGPRSPLRIELEPEERAHLEYLSRCTTKPAAAVRRATIVLLLAAGNRISDVARQVDDERRIVRKWGRRFHERRLEGLEDLPRPGRRPVFSPRGRASLGSAGLRGRYRTQ